MHLTCERSSSLHKKALYHIPTPFHHTVLPYLTRCVSNRFSNGTKKSFHKFQSVYSSPRYILHVLGVLHGGQAESTVNG